MNVCLICEASLSHHTLYNGKFGPRVYNVSRISLLAIKMAAIAQILKRTYDQKLETFFWPKKIFPNSKLVYEAVF